MSRSIARSDLRRVHLGALIGLLGACHAIGPVVPSSVAPRPVCLPHEVPGRVATAFLGVASDYQHSSRLPATPHDCQVMGDRLAGQGETITVLPRLTNGAGSAWQQVLARASAQDRVLFFYSGHGEGGVDGDFRLLAENESALPFSSLLGALQAAPQSSEKLRIYVLDSCCAGWLRLPDRGRHVILAAAPVSALASQVQGLSPFVFALEEGARTGIADENCDSYITVSEAARYVDSLLQELPAARTLQLATLLHRTTPEDPILFRVDDATMARRTECAPNRRGFAWLRHCLDRAGPADPSCPVLPAELIGPLRIALAGGDPPPRREPIWILLGPPPLLELARGALGDLAVIALGERAPGESPDPARLLAPLLGRFAEVYLLRLRPLGGQVSVDVSAEFTHTGVYATTLPVQALPQGLAGQACFRRLLKYQPFQRLAARPGMARQPCPLDQPAPESHAIQLQYEGRLPAAVEIELSGTVLCREVVDLEANPPSDLPCQGGLGSCVRIELKRCGPIDDRTRVDVREPC